LITVPPLLTGTVVVFVTYSFELRHFHLPRVWFFWHHHWMLESGLLFARKHKFFGGHRRKSCVKGGYALPKAKASFCLVMMGGVAPPSSLSATTTIIPAISPHAHQWCSLPWKRNAVSRERVRRVCPSPQRKR
jgi:hypothetical protein